MENQTSIILVEGKSESFVLPELCKKAGIEMNFEIKQQNSIDELKKALKTYLKSTNTLRKVWVIIDADKNIDGAWQSIKDILLRSHKYSFDSKVPLPDGGAIISPIDPDDLIIGVWIMPNNRESGMLEDFMLKLVPDGDSLMQEADSIIEKINNERENYKGLFKEVHKSKAKIHTWLAWHDAPGESLSVAIQKRLFDTNTELSRLFSEWLAALN